MIADGTIYIIDSSKRINGTDANFSYKIELPREKDYNRVVVLQALIPKSYYLVTAPYNTFILEENGTEVIITLPEGNYNVQSFINVVSNLLSSNSPNTWIYNIQYNDSLISVETGRFKYIVSGNSGQPSFKFNDYLYEQFGFVKNSVNIFVGDELVSTSVIKFQNEDVILIHSDISYNNDQSEYTDVLQEIYASSTPPMSNIVYQNSGNLEAYSKQLLSKNKSVFRFTLTDENNRELNLNNLNCVFTILVYRKDNINDLTRAFYARTILNDKLI